MKITLKEPYAESKTIALKRPFRLFVEASRGTGSGTGSGTLETSIELRCQGDTFKISPRNVPLRILDGNNLASAAVQVTVDGTPGPLNVVIDAVIKEGNEEDVQSLVLQVEASS